MKGIRRSYYIDNIRIVLTILVVLHHLAITYGGPGLWYYTEANNSIISSIILSLFIATNQSFFMGMFFMISAYFLEKSLKRKSVSHVLKDKLRRLIIPLLAYVLIISPLIMYLITRFDKGMNVSIGAFFQIVNWLTFGPLWFVAALFIFTMITLFLQNNKKQKQARTPFPSRLWILIGVIIMILCSFIVRVWFPVGWTLKPFGFQLAHFPQYIGLFYFGWIASKNEWLDKINYKQGVMCSRIVSILVFVLFPLVFYFGGALTNGHEIFMGGFSFQSFLYCSWEQTVGIGIIIAIIGVFKEKYNWQNYLLAQAAASAYTVYIIHALVLVIISISIKDIDISSTGKFFILAPIAVLFCFYVSNKLRKLPYLNKIL